MTKQPSLMEFLSKHGSTLPEETVHVSEWKRDVVLRGLSSRERDLFEEASLQRANVKSANGANRRGAQQLTADLANFRARLVARHIVENGMRTFANDAGEHILGEQPAAVLDKLFTVCQRLSGFSSEDIEQLTKNSEATDASEPNTDSPKSSDAPSRNSNGESANAS